MRRGGLEPGGVSERVAPLEIAHLDAGKVQGHALTGVRDRLGQAVDLQPAHLGTAPPPA